MTIKLKKGLIALLALLFIFNCILFLARPQTASAEEPAGEINYINQEYTIHNEIIIANLPWTAGFGNGDGGYEPNFSYFDNDYVFRIDCPDLSSIYTELSEVELVESKYIYIDFDGDYLYFVNGEARATEPKLLEYVEILYYDNIKNQVYVDFAIPGINIVDGIDVSLKQIDREAGIMCYVRKGDIIASGFNGITEKDFYFDLTVNTGNGFRKATNGTIFSIDMKLHLNKLYETAFYNFGGITLSIIEGNNNFELVKEYISKEDLEKQGEQVWEIFAVATNVNLTQQLTVKAELNYAGSVFYAQSTSNSLVGLWNLVYEDISAGRIRENTAYYFNYIYVDKYYDAEKDCLLPEYEDISVSKTIDQIKASYRSACWEEIGKYLTAYNSNLNTVINASIFNKITSSFAPESSHIYKIPLENLNEANIYFLNGQPGESTSYGGALKLYKYNNNIISYFYVYNPQYPDNNAGTFITMGTNKYFVQDNNYYFKLDILDVIKDQLAMAGYSTNLNVYFTALNNDGEDVAVQCNAQVITYDENVLNEINALKERVEELERLLLDSNKRIEELLTYIAVLESSIANLETAYNRLDARYNALNEKYIQALTEIENLKAEKNKAIEDLLTEVQAHQTTRATLEAQIAEKNGDIESLQAQLEEINALLSEKTAELEKAQKELSDLENRYEELDAEYQAFLASSSDELVAISALMHEYRMSIAQLEKQVAELQAQLEEERENNDKKNTAGCSAGCNGSGGSGIGTGAGDASITALGLALFAGVVYAKRSRTKEE